MDQPPPAPRIRSTPPSANGKRPVDPDALPPSAARRAQLLLMLIVLPVIAVSLPAILMTMLFGQQPKPKTAPAKSAKPAVVPTKAAIAPAPTPAKPAAVNDTTGLHEALQRTASTLLPTPSTLTGEPIKLTCRPERLTARAERVSKQAEAFGGTANEWLAPQGEKHFYVELPAGRADAFRQSLSGDAPAATPSPPASPSASPATVAIKDQVEVFIRANVDE